MILQKTLNIHSILNPNHNSNTLRFLGNVCTSKRCWAASHMLEIQDNQGRFRI